MSDPSSPPMNDDRQTRVARAPLRYPPPPEDPVAAWELRRKEWLTPRLPHSADIDHGHDARGGEKEGKEKEDSIVRNRLKILEEMMKDDIEDQRKLSQSRTSPSLSPLPQGELQRDSSTIVLAGGGRKDTQSLRVPIGSRRISVETDGLAEASTREPSPIPSPGPIAVPSPTGSPARVEAATREFDRVDLEEEPDGGSVIREKPQKEVLSKVIAGILKAFKDGRRMKEPVPLSFVTKILYRQWMVDGTIPPNYIAEKETNGEAEIDDFVTLGDAPPPVIGRSSANDVDISNGKTETGQTRFSPFTTSVVNGLPASRDPVQSTYQTGQSQEPLCDEKEKQTSNGKDLERQEGDGEHRTPEEGVARPRFTIGKLSSSSWRIEKDVESGGSDIADAI